jgi:hypothetical protein
MEKFEIDNGHRSYLFSPFLPEEEAKTHQS